MQFVTVNLLLAALPGLLFGWLPSDWHDRAADRRITVESTQIGPELFAYEASINRSQRSDEVGERGDHDQECGFLAKSLGALQVADSTHDNSSTHAIHWQFGVPRDAATTTPERRHVSLQI